MKFRHRFSRWIAGFLSLCLLGGMALLPTAAQTPSMTLERTEFAQGDDILVHYTGTSGKDWIAVYPKGEEPGGPPAVVYEYTSKTGQPDGTMDFKEPDRGDVKTLEPGEYDVYLLRDDGYDILAKASFSVKAAAPVVSDPSVSTDKAVYEVGETPVFSYTGSSHQDAWIGVYSSESKTPANGNPALVWKYTREIGQPAGSTSLKNAEGDGAIDRLPVGEYYVYLFADGGYTIVASATFTITLTPRDPATCPAPLAVYYDRTAERQGYADGSVSIKPPRGAEGLTGYRLYWGDENGPLEDYTEIPVRAAETGQTVRELNANTMIPYGATRLYAFAVYEDSFQSPDGVYTELPEGSAAVEEQPLYSFQVFSDTHIQTNPDHLHNRHLRMALADILKTDPDSAAIFTVGDTTDNGELGQYQQYNEIVSSFEGLPFIYSTPGNHDLRNETYQMAIDRFSNNTKSPNKYYAEKVEGATFIMLGSQDLDNWDLDRSAAHLKDDQMEFLKAELEKAADGMQPIFVFLHQPLYNTVSGSLPGQNWHGVDRDAEMREIFKQYPQVVFFTGHTHWELDAKSVMYAGNGVDATMFNDAAVGYLWTDEDTGKEGSQGFYIEVYADKILVRGRDFVAGKWIPSAQFIVDLSQNIKGLTAQISDEQEKLLSQKELIETLLEDIASLPAERRSEYEAEEQKLTALMAAIEELEKPAPDITKGDLNGDGKVTIDDVMEACKVLARKSAGTDPIDDEIDRGDLDEDGKITINDVMEICKVLARRA